MRRYDEPIEVKAGLVAGTEGPALFVWRNRLWQVQEVETRWLEVGDWWDGPEARAVRGDDGPESGCVTDLLSEEEIWRVVAAAGRSGPSGVYELGCTLSSGQWRLRTVLD